MNHAYQTKCTVEGVFDYPYEASKHIIVAPNKETAEKIAIERNKNWLGLSKKNEKKAVFSVDIKEIKGSLGKLIVMMDDFNSVNIGVSILGESTLVSLNNGKEFKVEQVSNRSGNIAVRGYPDDGTGRITILPISEVRKEDLSVILDSLDSAVGMNARPFLRQALLLEDLVNARSVYGDQIPARVLNLPGICCDARASRISDRTGAAVLLHWDFTGDFSRAMVIPETEFKDIERVIEAIEAFVNE